MWHRVVRSLSAITFNHLRKEAEQAELEVELEEC